LFYFICCHIVIFFFSCLAVISRLSFISTFYVYFYGLAKVLLCVCVYIYLIILIFSFCCFRLVSIFVLCGPCYCNCSSLCSLLCKLNSISLFMCLKPSAYVLVKRKYDQHIQGVHYAPTIPTINIVWVLLISQRLLCRSDADFAVIKSKLLPIRRCLTLEYRVR